MIQVQWYYRKQDLDMKKLGVTDDDIEYIGENEVFPTRHRDKVFADAIVSKCQVYSILWGGVSNINFLFHRKFKRHFNQSLLILSFTPYQYD